MLLLLLVGSKNLFAQKGLVKEKRIAINKSINYVNNCIDYIEAIQFTLEKFNMQLNQSIDYRKKSFARIKHKPLGIKYEGVPGSNKFSLEDLDKQYIEVDELNSSREGHDWENLAENVQDFQFKFEDLNNIVNELIGFTNQNNPLEDIEQYTRVYDDLIFIKEQMDLLQKDSSDLFTLMVTLYGNEKLPIVLQRTKRVAFLHKSIITSLREENKEDLKSKVKKMKSLLSEKDLARELRLLEGFGDFDYLDNTQGQQRANINRQTTVPIRIIKDYLKNKPAPCNNDSNQVQNDLNCWLNRILFLGDTRSTVIGRYNAYIERANSPVLHIVQEVKPYEVNISKDLPEIILEEEISTVAVETPQNIVLDKKDVSTLTGAKTNNLILLLDISGSMSVNDNDDKLKKSIKHLIDILREQDRLTIISYSGKPKVVLQTTVAHDKKTLKGIITKLKTGGKTNINTALKMAYKISKSNFINNGNNRIVVASDGDFKIKNAITNTINKASERDQITLSTFHFMSNNSKGKVTLKELALNGKGNYFLIEEETDAVNALVGESKQ